jgi:hypothetical protein
MVYASHSGWHWQLYAPGSWVAWVAHGGHKGKDVVLELDQCRHMRCKLSRQDNQCMHWTTHTLTATTAHDMVCMAQSASVINKALTQKPQIGTPRIFAWRYTHFGADESPPWANP